MIAEKRPRSAFAILQSPIEELPRLSALRGGPRPIVVRRGSPPEAENGNLLLDRLLGAEVMRTEAEASLRPST